jgi:hypothetical protein
VKQPGVIEEFVSRHWFALVLIAVVVTRAPYLFLGYGADPDAWLVANSAAMLWETGAYYPSRLPGYALHEFVSAPFVALGGAVASNTATLVVTLVALVVWRRLTHERAQHKRLILACLAFAPTVWQHSAETIDYVWSLLFVLLSWLAVERRRSVLAGILLGIATGFRPSNIVAILPFLFLIGLRVIGEEIDCRGSRQALCLWCL